MDKSPFAGPASGWRELSKFTPFGRFWRLHIRLCVSTAFGIAVTLALLLLPWRPATRILVGWDSGVTLYLSLISRLMARESIARIRERAAVEDEGAIVLLVLTTAAAIASLAAVLAELGESPTAYQVVLGLGTILLSWGFMHTIFALHYAHEFYGEGSDHRIGGLVFPAMRPRTIGTFSIIHS